MTMTFHSPLLPRFVDIATMTFHKNFRIAEASAKHQQVRVAEGHEFG
jgi:hypothetical protein